MSQIELDEALDAYADHILGRINVALPGVVMSYDDSTKTATVRPAVRGHYIDEDSEDRIAVRMPAIPKVPVLAPRFGGYFEIECPLAAGDHVLLLFCDRSIDEYMATGQTDNIPQDIRRFDISDAVALPVRTRKVVEEPQARLIIGTGGDITLANVNGAYLGLNNNNTLALGNTTADLVAETEALANAVSNLTTALQTDLLAIAAAGAGSSGTPVTNGTLATFFSSSSSAIAAVNAQVSAIKGLLATISE